MHTGAIWMVDDDHDDREMIAEVMKELKLTNELVYFTSGASVMKRLEEINAAPFIIISEVNLPQMDGFELRAAMLARPARKYHSVPFIYWSSMASEQQIEKAYELSAHGFFVKEHDFRELKNSFTQIIQYWQKSKMPKKSA